MSRVVSAVPRLLTGILADPPSVVPAPVVTTPAPTTPNDNKDADKAADDAAQAEQALLDRRRGRLGTIATSFRGVLSPDEDENGVNNLPRRTLLGE